MNDPQPPEGPRRAGGQILLAGLPPEVQNALAERLPGVWFHPVADNGEAFAALPRRRWDAVVVDHQLPGGGGADLVQELRAFSRGRAVPVLYCVHSTLPLETAHHLVHSLKVARLFFHPLDVGALAEQISSALPEREPVRAAPRGAPELASAVAGIWEKFRDVTLQRVATLEEAAVALLAGELSPELRRQAERDAHKLAGAVGTFGFAEGSQLARSVELLLEGTRPLTPADALTLSEWVNELRHRLESPPQPDSAPSRPAPAAAPSDEIARPDEMADGDRPRLLIASPDRDFADRVMMEAEGRGFETEWLPDPRAWVETGDARAAVVDLSATAADPPGLELVARLVKRNPASVVVAVSERDTLAERVEAARRGARAFLRKPVSPGGVVDCVAQHLAHGEVAGSKVMVMDDDETRVAMLQTLLETRGIEVVAVREPLQFWSRLESLRPDLIVLDQYMPDLRGVDLCRVLRAAPRWRDLPVLFLTDATDPAEVHRIFAAGADDFIRKPFLAAELLTRIATRLEQARLRTALHESTGPGGVPARARVSAEITRLLQIAGRQGESVAIARLDMDRFSEINERLGEPAADEILRRVSILLQTLLRAGDVVGWWGGDEFIVAMYATEGQVGVERLNEVRTAARSEPVTVEGEVMEITFSAGVAEYPVHGAELVQLCGAAEGALRQAKEAGGDRVAIAERSADAKRVELVDVVLVEDDDVLAELLLHAFGTQGIRARRLADGERALELLSGPEPVLRPRVILLDVDLPVVDGLTVLRELAREGIATRSHVVMLTVRSTESEVLEALELGAADHVAKPFSVPSLLQRVRSQLHRA